MSDQTDELTGVEDFVSSTTVTDTVDTISASDLDAAGINFMTEPDLNPEWVKEMQSWGLSTDEVDQIESAFKIDKAMSDREWMGVNFSASDELKSFSIKGDMGLAKSDVVDLGFDVNNLRQAETVRSQIAVSIDGIDTPINVLSLIHI